MLSSILLLGMVVCGDSRDIPDFTAPPCPESKQVQQCGCGNTIMWDLPVPPEPEWPPGTIISVERCLFYSCTWAEVLQVPAERRWFHHSEEHPLPSPSYLYWYRFYTVLPDGTRSEVANNMLKYRAIPIVCMDDVYYKRVPCWGP